MDDREGGVQSAVTLVGCSASRVLSVGWVRPGEQHSWVGTLEEPGKEPFSPMCLYSSVRALFPPPGKSPAQGAASRSFWLLWSNWLLPA